MNSNLDMECKMLLELNDFIHHDNKMFEYHMNHIQLVKRYALLLNRRLDAHLDNHKLAYIALAHDLFKERSLDPSRTNLRWRGCLIPQDTNRYVRMNLDDLEEFGLDEYFNSSVQYHPLTAGLFLKKEFGIKDKEILYPVMFHSCPIISIYKELPKRTQTIIDIIMLSDKLSSNYLRINMREVDVKIDLDLAVFGSNGCEFNYTLGLYLARLISQGHSIEEQSMISTDYYHKRLCSMNPIYMGNTNNKLGGATIWQKRKSQAFRTH